jgi:hypothetical protein
MIPPCAVWSPILAAGLPPIRTLVDPIRIVSGAGLTQVHISPTTAAGIFPIKTVGTPGPIIGPPTCGFGPSDIGQVCISPTLAAGVPIISFF